VTGATILQEIPTDRLGDFCRRWKVRELSVFGSAIRDDFGPDSDVDVLVELESGHGLSLFGWGGHDRRASANLRP